MMSKLAYDEFVDFIAGGSTPKMVVDFQPSAETKSRVQDLICRNESKSLTADELLELSYYLQIEHFVRLAKAKARHHIQASSSGRFASPIAASVA